ncbi:MAG: hypothetical protein KGZ32_00200 [Dethiobacter sp.]|jgi:hypothetical protein|nr:hypothetical protein [Dethiobacter sp.]
MFLPVKTRIAEPANLSDKTTAPHIFRVILLTALLAAVALAVIMATTSAFDSHPDERVHFEAVEYYSGDNWLPPAIGDPETLDSYSAFGKSRLNLPDFYYLAAGKFTALLTPLTGNILLSARLFNILLLLILVLMALRTPGDQWLIYAVLLLTPQIWYTFSYVNSDAFAIFLTFLISAQLVNDKSRLMQYFNSPTGVHQFYKSLPTILSVTLLYFAKENFRLYFLFLIIWGLWFLYIRSDRRQILVKTMVMIFLFAALVSAKYALDYSIHGPNRGENLREIQELTAEPEFRPSVRDIDAGHPDLNLKRRGVDALALFREPYNWHLGTFFTFAGAYGHMEFFGSANYYRLMLILYIVLTLFLIYRLWPAGWEARYFLIALILLSAYILYLAFYFSWESAFQPQGRYLFPVLGIIAYLFGRFSRVISKSISLYILLSSAALLSVYSFIFYGLIYIPRA